MSVCKICFEEIKESGVNSYRKDLCICQKCFNKFEPKFYRFKIGKINVLSIYEYDDQIKEKLFLLKGCFDIEIAPIFLNRFLPELKRMYKDYYVVPFPSTFEDDERRGFNHVEEIFKGIGIKQVKALRKKTNFKQSSLNLQERKQIINKIEGKDLLALSHRKILLVDDVMTTGSSIRAGIEIIASCQPKEISVLILSKKREISKKKANAFTRIKNKIIQC